MKAGQSMTRAELIELLICPDPHELFAEADRIRQQATGDGIFLRGIIEFSNHCVRNCLYCGLRRANTELPRFRMHPADVVRRAVDIARQGIGTVVLQSGDDLDYAAEDIADIIRAIKRRADMAVVLSVGEREPWEYQLWRDAGADRYLIKHEISDPDLYARLHPGKTLQERLHAQHLLRDLGYELGTGCIIGLPGQTAATLADDILLTRDLGATMCGVGPFVPQASTPLAELTTGSVPTTLRVIALLRITSPHLNLPATTALATLDPEHGQTRALQAGANVIMPNFTPTAERSKYRIYDHKLPVDLRAAREAAAEAGRYIIQDGKVHT